MSKSIKKDKLRYWLTDYLTDSVHGLRMGKKEKPSVAFNSWAKHFKREEASFLVEMEYWEWEEDERTEIPLEEVVKYADSLLQTIVNNWYK